MSVLICFTALFLCNVLVTSTYARELTEYTCPDGSTKIYSPYLYASDGPSCEELLDEDQGVYHPPFITECGRWLPGNDHDTITDYEVIYCDHFENGTTVYRALICCTGEPEGLLCFTCDGAANDHECAFDGSIEQCQDGEVCQSVEDFQGEYPDTTNSWSKGCVDQGECYADSAQNPDTCVSFIPDPQCVHCCDTSFCNYDTPESGIEVGSDACVSGPCANGGTCMAGNSTIDTSLFTCVCDEHHTGVTCEVYIGPPLPCDSKPCKNGAWCVVSGETFVCHCKPAWTGSTCSEPTPHCGDGYCLNGGTCYDRGEIYGLRCICTADFVGSRCEIPGLTCKHEESYWIDSRTFIDDFNNKNCTSHVTNMNLHGDLQNEDKLEVCRQYMQQPGRPLFENNVNGEVDELEARSYATCNKGDVKAWNRPDMCCPSCYSMPCRNGAWCTQLDDGDYLCKCRKGWYGTNCDQKENYCLINGDPHYTTFDGAVMHFQGKCVYTLSSTIPSFTGGPHFTITTENENRPALEGVSWVRSFEVQIENYIIQLNKRGQVKVNGHPVHPDVEYDDFRLLENGNFVRLETHFGLVVEYDGRWLGKVVVPALYGNSLTGICGNLDGEEINDFTTKEGVNMADDPDRDQAVGDSWLIPGNGPPECRGNFKKTARRSSYRSVTASCQDIEATIAGNQFCGLIQDTQGVFSQCIADDTVNHQYAFESCVYDVCAMRANQTEMKLGACGALEAFNVQCGGAGYSVNWRVQAGCPLECPSGMAYMSSSSACHATCRVPDGPSRCHLANTESCVCPDGTVLHNGTCRDPRDCGCVDNYGNMYKIGDTWLSDDCKTVYVCDVCTDCVLPVGRMNGRSHNCKAYQDCTAEMVGIGHCLTSAIWLPTMTINNQPLSPDTFIPVETGKTYEVRTTVPEQATPAHITMYKLVEDVPDHHGDCRNARECVTTIEIAASDQAAAHVMIGSHVDYGAFLEELEFECRVSATAAGLMDSRPLMVFLVVVSLVNLMRC